MPSVAAGDDSEGGAALGVALEVGRNARDAVRRAALVPVAADALRAVGRIAVPAGSAVVHVQIRVLGVARVGLDDVADHLEQSLVEDERPELRLRGDAIGEGQCFFAENPSSPIPDIRCSSAR